jgi:hypothetical protein
MGQRCLVCGHPEAKAINAELGKVAIPTLAERFGVSRFALERHRERHTAAESLHKARSKTPPPPRRQPVVDDTSDTHRGVTAEPKRTTRATVASVDARKQVFLAEFARHGNISAAAIAAGIGRSSVYKWQETSDSFALAFREAETMAVERLELEAYTRATEGSRLVRKIYRNGELVETVEETRPSDSVLIRLLAALRPEKFGDRVAVTQTSIVRSYTGFDPTEVL